MNSFLIANAITSDPPTTILASGDPAMAIALPRRHRKQFLADLYDHAANWPLYVVEFSDPISIGPAPDISKKTKARHSHFVFVILMSRAATYTDRLRASASLLSGEWWLR